MSSVLFTLFLFIILLLSSTGPGPVFFPVVCILLQMDRRGGAEFTGGVLFSCASLSPCPLFLMGFIVVP